MKKTIGILLLVACILLPGFGASAEEDEAAFLRQFSNPGFGNTERLELAEAYLNLFDEGFPGPSLFELGPEVIRAPIVILDSIESGGRSDRHPEVEMRACLAAARCLRLLQLANRAEANRSNGPNDGLSMLKKAVSRCSDSSSGVGKNNSMFCSAAGVRAVTAKVSARTLLTMERRCGPMEAALARLENAISRELPELPGVPVLERSTWFERGYASELTGLALKRRRLKNNTGRCTETGDCKACRLAARELYLQGQNDRAGNLVTLMAGEDSRGKCEKEAMILLAWRQDWSRFDELNQRLPEPVEPWAEKLSLYRAILLGSLGDGDQPLEESAMEHLDKVYSGQAEYETMKLAIWGLERLTAVLRGESSANAQVNEFLLYSRRPEIRARPGDTFPILLTLISGLADAGTLVSFMDEFLSDQQAASDCRTITQAALEILSIALRDRDADRLQQAIVLLDKVRSTCTDMVVHGEVEVFQHFANWADLRLSKKPRDALVNLKHRSQSLVLRQPKEVRQEVRSMLILNLLAAILATRQECAPDIPSFLEDVTERTAAYYVLWVYHLMHQRRRAEAYAVSRLCERVAPRDEQRGACLLWQASIHDLLGRRKIADELAREGRRLCSGSVKSETVSAAATGLTDSQVVCLLKGDRKLRIVLDWEGELTVASAYSPRFILILLPHLASPMP